MAKKKTSEIKLVDMTSAELMVEAKRLRDQIAKTRLEMAVGRVKNLRLGFNLRKRLARVLTVLNNKLMIK